MTLTTHEVHLVKRPIGLPAPSDFQMVEREVPDLRPGEVLVRNCALSVDPAMRPRMNDVPSYIAPYELGKPMGGSAVGRVLLSSNPTISAGTWVTHREGWREHSVVSEGGAQVVHRGDFPSSYHLGVLGLPGLTAYAGIHRIAQLKGGDVVYVSGAAGAVGGLAGQFARLRGASLVIGSAGSAEKTHYLTEILGFDAAFNYREGELQDSLRRLLPDGFDVYFDNVGGDHLAAALEVIRDCGRIVLCGMISGYNDLRPQAFNGNLFRAISKRLRLEGYIVSDHLDLWTEFETDVANWLTQGQIQYAETVTYGLSDMPTAFIGMLDGVNTGKSIVRLVSDEEMGPDDQRSVG